MFTVVADGRGREEIICRGPYESKKRFFITILKDMATIICMLGPSEGKVVGREGERERG